MNVAHLVVIFAGATGQVVSHGLSPGVGHGQRYPDRLGCQLPAWRGRMPAVPASTRA